MNKRMISLFTLIVFTVFTFSCYSTRVNTKSRLGEDVKILEVFTTSGDQIKFSKKMPGTITGDKIVGVIYEAGRKIVVYVPLSDVQYVKIKANHGKLMGKIIEVDILVWLISSFLGFLLFMIRGV